MTRFVKLVAIFIISLFVEFNQGSDIDIQLNQQIEFGILYKKNLATCEELRKTVKRQIISIHSEIHAIDPKLSAGDEEINKLKSDIKLYSRNLKDLSCIGKLSDVYDIQVPKFIPTTVFCDSNLIGPGWTVIQRRVNGKVDFERKWNDYKTGFGNLRDSFFIGLENLYSLTNWVPHELYISMKSFKGEHIYARYSHFVIGSEFTFYKILSLGNYTGNRHDCLKDHLNTEFYTSDRDNALGHARQWHCGWWYPLNCCGCLLNGLYHKEWLHSGIRWNSKNEQLNFNFVQMMIKPISQ